MPGSDPAVDQYGIEIDAGADIVTATMEITDSMLNSHGTCHGGVLFLLADAVFDYASNGPQPDDKIAFAAHAEIDFVQAGLVGDRLTATGSRVDVWGRTTLVDVTITNQRDEPVAHFRGRTRTVVKREP